MLLILLVIGCGCSINCGINNPPIAIQGVDFDDWAGHPGGVCFSKEYAARYLKWKNNK